jgi:hypothetical protein
MQMKLPAYFAAMVKVPGRYRHEQFAVALGHHQRRGQHQRDERKVSGPANPP